MVGARRRRTRGARTVAHAESHARARTSFPTGRVATRASAACSARSTRGEHENAKGACTFSADKNCRAEVNVTRAQRHFSAPSSGRATPACSSPSALPLPCSGRTSRSTTTQARKGCRTGTSEDPPRDPNPFAKEGGDCVVDPAFRSYFKQFVNKKMTYADLASGKNETKGKLLAHLCSACSSGRRTRDVPRSISCLSQRRR